MNPAEHIGAAIRRCVDKGGAVEIDGFGTFRRSPFGEIGFEAQEKIRVFIAYVAEDAAMAERLFDDLAARGLDPWMDRRKLLPGQNWPRAIEQAISVADFFIACFSRRAVLKRGRFQAELRYALDCAAHVPLDQVYLIPVRFEQCRVPARITQQYQYVDMFPDWETGIRRLAASMRCPVAA